ncbi:TspO/MBR family protein [Romboutsia sp.]|uniref:TspO/MBR family protein n=1 Tax=Romboutsia sp. TaxID=1965302 RepID=UPI003F3026FA
MIISVKEVKNFLISVFIPLAIGYTSSFLSRLLAGESTTTYYSQLIKPGFAPPSFVFPLVWTILFILMGISVYIIMKNGYEKPKVRDAMFYYWLQLGLVFLWSILFFGLDLRFTALIDLIILIIVVVMMILKFIKIDKKAAYLNIPYLIWLLYALFLNYFIWVINK